MFGKPTKKLSYEEYEKLKDSSRKVSVLKDEIKELEDVIYELKHDMAIMEEDQDFEKRKLEVQFKKDLLAKEEELDKAAKELEKVIEAKEDASRAELLSIEQELLDMENELESKIQEEELRIAREQAEIDKAKVLLKQALDSFEADVELMKQAIVGQAKADAQRELAEYIAELNAEATKTINTVLKGAVDSNKADEITKIVATALSCKSDTKVVFEK